MTVSDATQANVAPTVYPRRVLLVSIPRTASNLLLKVLDVYKQPKVLTSPQGGYFFYPAFVAAAQNDMLSKPGEQWTEEEKSRVQQLFQECFQSWEDWTEEAQKEKKIMFAKEHAFWIYNPASLYKMMSGYDDPEFWKSLRCNIPKSYGPSQTYSPSNETVLSDEYLRSWQLAFIIRHPALSCPSFYRAMIKVKDQGYIDEDGIAGASMANMSMRWTRKLYDWSMEQPDVPIPPPVVDAHDLIHSPEVLIKFCEQTGLDKDSLKFEWGGKDDVKKSLNWAAPDANADAAKKEEHRKAAEILLGTLEASSGIIKDKAPANINIDAEVAKWKVEFGDEVAQLLEKQTRDSMEDYEYLKARRLTV
ncbi:hypothetical protein N7462_003303 [Penicillium macrosclerotiorum]|uniref:uncharacterized protein n=1 Tax=Penicillium macrosclerotiorum TaxID=303699 RepID=UPI0025467209|nr:uncharacterized protein N7462_003303 [Penicillium macrosclerotiorum]KAJ5688911.1 hypothetical protein N7462_003303 [Penicillium macrosclerotiorum]